MRFQQIVLEITLPLTVAFLGVVSVTMIVRHLVREARFFFIYIVSQAIAVPTIYVLIHFAARYWWWYGSWANNLACMVLEFAVIIEIFNIVFAPYDGIRQFAKVVTIWSAAVLLAIAVILVSLHEVAFSAPVLTVFLVAERSVRVVQLGLILTLFGLSRYLHLRLRDLSFGIALGFGFYALIVLVTLVVRMYYGQPFAGVSNMVELMAYCASAMVWAFYTLQPEVVRVAKVTMPSHELERWDRALAQLLGRTSSSSISAAGK